ncbi:MAG: DUF2062 domain-containing protein [Candidatus Woesearchaeota archaeon]
MMKRTQQRFKDKVAHHFRDVLKAKYSPHTIAFGFSLGTFLAIFPTPGLSIVIGFFLLLIFSRINKLSLMAAFAFWNPVTLIPVYLVSYHIGALLVGELPEATVRVHLIGQAYNFTRSFLIGNIILSIVLGIISYLVVKRVATVYYKKIREKDDEDFSQQS